jgi:PTS system N-acetylglucosamine-specific IIC component
MVIMSLLGVHLGYTFSAGLIDYLINFKIATRPLLLLPIGLAYSVLYYGLFRFFIQRFNLATPGREAAGTAIVEQAPTGTREEGFVLALGGAGNLVSIDACTTRLRLIVADQSKIDEPALKALGARGVIRPSDKAVQIVLGPIADQVAGEIRDAAATGRGSLAPPAIAPSAGAAGPVDAEGWFAALGGRANLASGGVCSTRLYLTLADPGAVDEAALRTLGALAFARPSAASLHVVVGPGAAAVGAALALEGT